MKCACCSNPIPFEVFETIVLGDGALRRAEVQTAAADRNETLIHDRGASAHEAGHALAALAHGDDLRAVAIGEYPMTISQKSPHLSPLRCLIDFCAGDVGEGLASGYGSPSIDVLHAYIKDARKDDDGHCDFCKSARLLVTRFPLHSDDALAEAWASAFEITRALLKTPAWSGAFWRVADALRESRRLFGDEVAGLVDADDLRDVEARLLVSVDGFDIETWSAAQ
ncbi:MAG: hypothetical protein ACR65X_13115 [Methylocystis sp.]